MYTAECRASGSTSRVSGKHVPCLADERVPGTALSNQTRNLRLVTGSGAQSI